jgi:hypothetical protein
LEKVAVPRRESVPFTAAPPAPSVFTPELWRVRPLYVNFHDDGSLEEEYGEEGLFHMPDLRGKTVRSVLRLTREIPLEIKVMGSGKAMRQKPLPGERIAQGTSAEVWFK